MLRELRDDRRNRAVEIELTQLPCALCIPASKSALSSKCSKLPPNDMTVRIQTLKRVRVGELGSGSQNQKECKKDDLGCTSWILGHLEAYIDSK